MDPIKKDPLLRIIRHIVVTEYRKMLKKDEATYIIHGPTNRGGYHAEIGIEFVSNILNAEPLTGVVGIWVEGDLVTVKSELTRALSNTKLSSVRLLEICDPNFTELLRNAITEHRAGGGDPEMAIGSQAQT